MAQEALIQLYQQASVVVLPALSEGHFGIPNVLLEAMAVETPVVCTALPSLSEVMEHGKHGLYVPERDPEALADALQVLARDPERCRAMGKAGRRKVEELFDAEWNVSALAALLRPGIGEATFGNEVTCLPARSPHAGLDIVSHPLTNPQTGD
jgi:glycosyltransferase involved in cell wall biosynthesis